MRKFTSVLAVILSLTLIAACFAGCQKTDDTEDTDTATASSAASVKIQSDIDIDLDDIEGSIDLDSAYEIVLSDSGSTAEGGAEVDGSKIKITAGGVYVISGTLSDGQIKVNLDDESESVVLVLNGADITNKSGAAIHVKKALSAYLVAWSGSKNTVSDTSNYEFSADDTDGEPDAAIFSKTDLIVGGSGTLSVNANYSTGIKSKDNLVITGLSLNVESVDDGIKGRDGLEILGGSITVTAENDGIKTTNDQDASLGNIVISGGNITVTAGTDGIQSDNSMTVTGGTISINAGGGASSASSATFGFWGSSSSDESAKGLKAENTITITGGTVTVDSADDAVHTNDIINISGGDLTLASGDDGVHADNELNISGGSITVTESYEGLEAAVINISDGVINIKASDDGINAAGGNDSSQTGGFGGGDMFDYDESAMISFTGGYVYINADGDGFDSNGDAEMSGGTLIIDGPTNGGNGAIDMGGDFTVTGGTLIAAGASGMAETASSTSTQGVIQFDFNTQSAGTRLTLTDSSGNVIVSYAPSKTYANVVISTSSLKVGETYTLYAGGSVSGGTESDGVTVGGTVSGGSEISSLNLSSIVTSEGGNTMGGGMGGQMGGMNGGDMGGNSGGMNGNSGMGGGPMGGGSMGGGRGSMGGGF